MSPMQVFKNEMMRSKAVFLLQTALHGCAWESVIETLLSFNVIPVLLF